MQHLRTTAALTAGLNALGLAFAAGAMWPGAPDAPLEARLEFLAARPLGWAAGWGVWMLAAVALVAFFVQLARSLRGGAGTLALALVCMGASVDLLCDALQLVVVPLAAEAALRRAGDPALFLLLERACWTGGVVVACGLYCLATAVATAGLAGEGRAGPVLWLAALATLGGGAVWVGAELAQARALLAPATAVTVGSFIGWALTVAASTRRA